MVKSDRYEVIGGAECKQLLERTKRAVFASMDLPPLFPYMNIKVGMEEWFEDGGVVDNLPVWFGTQIERCDLLFVLPLNASFSEPVNHTSISKRLFRVMDVRQGVLERNSLKLAYLYNELATVRKRGSGPGTETGGLEESRQEGSMKALETRLQQRKHDLLSIFSICPQEPLDINTTEFWKPTEAGRAFDLMYAQTKAELEDKFEEDTNPEWIKMVLVSPLGERTYLDEF